VKLYDTHIFNDVVAKKTAQFDCRYSCKICSVAYSIEALNVFFLNGNSSDIRKDNMVLVCDGCCDFIKKTGVAIIVEDNDDVRSSCISAYYEITKMTS